MSVIKLVNLEEAAKMGIFSEGPTRSESAEDILEMMYRRSTSNGALTRDGLQNTHEGMIPLVIQAAVFKGGAAITEGNHVVVYVSSETGVTELRPDIKEAAREIGVQISSTYDFNEQPKQTDRGWHINTVNGHPALVFLTDIYLP